MSSVAGDEGIGEVPTDNHHSSVTSLLLCGHLEVLHHLSQRHAVLPEAFLLFKFLTSTFPF